MPENFKGAALWVLDTNVVLDVLLFDHLLGKTMRTQIQTQQAQWLATEAMVEEFVRVLHYPAIAKRCVFYNVTAMELLRQMRILCQVVDAAPKAIYTCKDPDDQKFIDLASWCHAKLWSKDRHILTMRKRLAQLGVEVVRWE